MDRDHIGLIASDMDYTLLDENGHLPEGFARLVGALEEAGIYFAAASGPAGSHRPDWRQWRSHPLAGPGHLPVPDAGVGLP